MTGRRLFTAAMLLLLGLSTGCCRWWCEHHCPQQGGVAGYAAPAAPACQCYPQPAYYPPAQAAPPASWAQPRTVSGCTCTCPP